MSEIEQESQVLSRRRVLNLASASIGALVASPALADSLADVPPREPGADLSAHSERSKYVKIDRIPEAGPGMRNVDPDNAINAKTPHQKLLGSITPTDVHYERSHAGVPDIDPAQHRLLIHGMVQKPLVLSVDDLKAMPSVSSNAPAMAGRTGKRPTLTSPCSTRTVSSAPMNGPAFPSNS
jgi:sulfane dehydrogenase subunit SoxC